MVLTSLSALPYSCCCCCGLHGEPPLVNYCANVTKLIGCLHHWDICLGSQEAKMTKDHDRSVISPLSVPQSVHQSMSRFNYSFNVAKAFRSVCVNASLIAMGLNKWYGAHFKNFKQPPSMGGPPCCVQVPHWCFCPIIPLSTSMQQQYFLRAQF